MEISNEWEVRSKPVDEYLQEKHSYFDGNGYRVTGCTIAGKKYYFMSDCHMHTGWLSFGSCNHDDAGWCMHTGWLSFGSTYYYMNDEGLRVTGWQMIAGKKYHLMPDGTEYIVMARYHLASTYYYMMPDGHMHTGWLSFGSTYYYLNNNGVRVTGWQTIE